MLSGSGASSNFPNIISGLLLTVTIDEAVFRRSSLCCGIGGEKEASLAVEVFRESQENGLVKLLFVVIGVGVGVGPGDICGCGALGGGPQGTEGRTPDRPCRDGLEFLAGRGGLVFSGAGSIRFGKLGRRE